MYLDAMDMVEGGVRADLQDALAQLYCVFRSWEKRNRFPKISIPIFSLNMLGLNSSAADYPTLAQTIKGWKSKQLCTWVSYFGIQVASQECAGEEQCYRGLLCYHLYSYIQITDKGGIFLTRKQVEYVCLHGWRFLRWWQFMASRSMLDGKCAFKLRPKLHGFAHQLLQIQDTAENPAKLSLWSAEDLVGQSKRVTKTARGPSMEFGSSHACRPASIYNMSYG